MQSRKHTKQTYKPTGRLLRAQGARLGLGPHLHTVGLRELWPWGRLPWSGAGLSRGCPEGPREGRSEIQGVSALWSRFGPWEWWHGKQPAVNFCSEVLPAVLLWGLLPAPESTTIYSILFYSFYSVLSYPILIYSILFYIMYHITPSLHPFIPHFPFPHFCFPGIAPPSEVLIPTLCPCLVFWEAWVKTIQLGWFQPWKIG